MEEKSDILNWLLWAGALALLLGATAWLGYDMQTIVEGITKERRSILEEQRTIQSITTLKSGFDEAKGYVDILERLLPTKDALINFPKEMNELGRQQNIEATVSFGTETAGNESSPGSIQFLLNARGAYDAIANFLKAVEESRYLVAWDNIDISEHAGKYEAKINGKVFSRS